MSTEQELKTEIKYYCPRRFQVVKAYIPANHCLVGFGALEPDDMIFNPVHGDWQPCSGFVPVDELTSVAEWCSVLPVARPIKN